MMLAMMTGTTSGTVVMTASLREIPFFMVSPWHNIATFWYQAYPFLTPGN
jgi:hypothetical protein